MARRKKQETAVQEPVQAPELVSAAEIEDRVLGDLAVERVALEQEQDREAERVPVQQAPQIVLLDPYEIQAPVELNTRRFQTPRESIVGLAISMLEDGQQEPVKVIPLPDSTYQLVFGFRRWQAAVMINEERLSETPFQLQAIVVDAAPLPASIVENTQRVGLGPVDEAYAIQQLAAAGVRQRDIANKMGLSQALVSSRLRLLDLPAEIQRQVNDNGIPVGVALLSLTQPEGPKREADTRALTPPAISDTDVLVDQSLINTDMEVRNEPEPKTAEKAVKYKTAKQMLAELEEYATPTDDSERTKAQVWLLTKLMPWIRNPKRRLQKVMEALEELAQ